MSKQELNLAQAFIETHSIAAARELELLPTESILPLLDELPSQQAQQLLMQMLPSRSAQLISQLCSERSAELLADAEVSHLAAILRCLKKPVRTQLLQQLPAPTASLCRLLLSYSDDLVGAWIIADIIALPHKTRADNALTRLANSRCICDSDAIPVVDDNNFFVGLIGVRTLLNAAADIDINQLVDSTRPVLSSRASLASVIDHKGWNSYDTLPVINRHRQLVGLLRHVDLRQGLIDNSTPIEPQAESDTLSDFGRAYSASIMSLLALFDSKASRGGKNNA